MQMKRRSLLLMLSVLLIFSFPFIASAGCSAKSGIPSETSKYSADWPVSNKDYSNTRTAKDASINLQNVASLGVAWSFDIPGVGEWGAATTNPLVLGDIVYLQDSKSNIFAIDLKTGKLIWKKEYNLDVYGPNGPAAGWDKLFVNKGHYDVAALDLKNGSEIWSTRLSSKEPVGVDIQLTVYNDLVYVSTVPGTSNADFYTGGSFGMIYALDQKTGKVKWQFNTVDSEDVWGNPKVNSGGGAWYPPAIDVNTGVMYWGIGNPAPWPGTKEFPNGSSRPGPNLYTNSILALDSNSGRLLWYKQVRSHDLFDLDFQISPVLTTATINGKKADIAIGTGKLGKVYAFDRKTGEIYWQTPVGQHQNDELKELPAGTTRVLPGPLGGVETPMALADGVLYVPVVNLFGDYTSTNFVATTFDIGAGKGELVALDVATGKPIWSKSFNSINIGAATVVNDLVFTSTFNGMIYAFDRKTGDKLWDFQAPGGINGWPAVSRDFIIFPIGLGPNPKLIAFQIGKATTAPPVQTPGPGPATPTAKVTVPFQADGIINPGEYAHQQTFDSFELYWANDATTVYVGMKAKTTGFVALGIQPGSQMKDADMIFGLVKDGKTEVFDLYSTGSFGPHPQDTELGGTNDIREFGGKEEGGYTVIEFKRALVTNDKYDQPLVKGTNNIIWAYGTSDDLQIKHTTRGYGSISID